MRAALAAAALSLLLLPCMPQTAFALASADGTSGQGAAVELPRASMVFKISGDSPFDYPVFTFSLKAQKTGCPMPADAGGTVKSCTLQGAGAVDFGSVSVEKPGVYTYTIFQEPAADAAWECDASVYELKIVVTQKDDGLQATKSLVKDGQQQDEAAFVNSYRPSAVAAQSAEGAGEAGVQDEPAAQEPSVEVGPLTLEEQEEISAPAGGGDAQSGQPDEAPDAAGRDTAAEPQVRPQPAADGLGTDERAVARTSARDEPQDDPAFAAAAVTAAVTVISAAGVALATFIRTRKEGRSS